MTPSFQSSTPYDPKKTLAVLIGVEKYDVSPKWNLNGPVNDAIHFAQWLQRQGVPTDQLYFFLSPLTEPPSNAPPLASQLQVKAAEENSLFKFLTNQLPSLAEQSQCNSLFFFWAGHGVVTDEQQNCLFCSDATERSKLHINLDSLLQMMRSSFYAKLTRQTFIIDACANYFSSMRAKATLTERSFPHEDPLATIGQEVLLAAAPGQITQNNNLRNSGEFSDFLLTTLNAHTTPSWPPDLQPLHQAARQLVNQKPFYLCLTSGNEKKVDGKWPQPHDAVTPPDTDKGATGDVIKVKMGNNNSNVIVGKNINVNQGR